MSSRDKAVTHSVLVVFLHLNERCGEAETIGAISYERFIYRDLDNVALVCIAVCFVGRGLYLSVDLNSDAYLIGER